MILYETSLIKLHLYLSVFVISFPFLIWYISESFFDTIPFLLLFLLPGLILASTFSKTILTDKQLIRIRFFGLIKRKIDLSSISEINSKQKTSEPTFEGKVIYRKDYESILLILKDGREVKLSSFSEKGLIVINIF